MTRTTVFTGSIFALAALISVDGMATSPSPKPSSTSSKTASAPQPEGLIDGDGKGKPKIPQNNNDTKFDKPAWDKLIKNSKLPPADILKQIEKFNKLSATDKEVLKSKYQVYISILKGQYPKNDGASAKNGKSTAAAPIPSAAAPIPSAAASIPSAAASIPSAAAPIPSAAAPMPSAAAPIPSAAAPMPSAAAPMPSAAAPMPSAAAPIPSAAAPSPTHSSETVSSINNNIPKLSAEDQKNWDDAAKASGQDIIALYRLIDIYRSPHYANEPYGSPKNIVYRDNLKGSNQFYVDVFEGKINNKQSPAPEISTHTPINAIDPAHWEMDKIESAKVYIKGYSGKQNSASQEQVFLDILNEYIKASDEERTKKIAFHKIHVMILNDKWPRYKYPFLAQKFDGLKIFNDYDIEVSYEGGGPEGTLMGEAGKNYTIKQGEKITLQKGTVSGMYLNPSNWQKGTINEKMVETPSKKLALNMFTSRVTGEDSKSLMVNMDNLKTDVKKIIFRPGGKSTFE